MIEDACLYEFQALTATDEFRWYVVAKGSTPHLRSTASGFVLADRHFQVIRDIK